jgi:hypothetical protein
LRPNSTSVQSGAVYQVSWYQVGRGSSEPPLDMPVAVRTLFRWRDPIRGYAVNIRLRFPRHAPCKDAQSFPSIASLKQATRCETRSWLTFFFPNSLRLGWFWRVFISQANELNWIYFSVSITRRKYEQYGASRTIRHAVSNHRVFWQEIVPWISVVALVSSDGSYRIIKRWAVILSVASKPPAPRICAWSKECSPKPPNLQCLSSSRYGNIRGSKQQGRIFLTGFETLTRLIVGTTLFFPVELVCYAYCDCMSESLESLQGTLLPV